LNLNNQEYEGAGYVNEGALLERIQMMSLPVLSVTFLGNATSGKKSCNKSIHAIKMNE